jgi:hypothetical protein
VAFSQNTDTGLGVVRCKTGVVNYERYGLPDMDVYTSRFEAPIFGQAPQGSRPRPSAREAFEEALKSPGTCD